MPDLLLGVFIGVVLGIIAHEAGHAAMASLAGFRLRAIIIGNGPTLFAGQYRGIDIRLNSIPLGGMIVIFPEMYSRKTAMLMLLSGGVTANFLLVLGVLALDWLGHLPANHHQAAIGFYCTQAFLIVGNLIPRTASFGGVAFRNDGMALLSILKRPDNSLSPAAESYLSMLANYANGKDPISTVSPATLRIMLFLVLNQIRGDRRIWEQNFRNLVAEIEKGELSDEEEMLVLDALVTEAVVRGSAAARASMDDWSARAMRFGAHIKAIRLSRAAVLIELGRFAEGKALIESSEPPDDSSYDFVLSTIFLARAEVALGDHNRAEELLTQASTQMAAHPRQHNWIAEYRLLDRVHNAIEKGRSALYQS